MSILDGFQVDDYEDTGCYNLECPRFVQVDRKVALGSSIQPISIYSGQHVIYVSIIKNLSIQKKYMHILSLDQRDNFRIKIVGIGGYPSRMSIWDTSPEKYSLLKMKELLKYFGGGEMINTQPDGHHTATQMGSGHFPFEGFGKASFYRNLKFIDASFNERNGENVVKYVTQASML
ncbi:uncharacterized protein LOC130136274 [Syzygium oleosum]|uniref:uncharacterized protein LOC130136274 n=1 Tax=Syzygium oleosum TaxID=219896 RepID=UPI0024BBD91B|nr:uncharacterized protein LOC130136274 [Syzygium oleosum]